MLLTFSYNEVCLGLAYKSGHYEGDGEYVFSLPLIHFFSLMEMVPEIVSTFPPERYESIKYISPLKFNSEATV